MKYRLRVVLTQDTDVGEEVELTSVPVVGPEKPDQVWGSAASGIKALCHQMLGESLDMVEKITDELLSQRGPRPVA